MELLRIVAMLMIVVYHTFYYRLQYYQNSEPIFASLTVILHIGVILFVLISGYFGIKPSVKGFLRLYSVVVFYDLVLYSLSIGFGEKMFSWEEALKCTLPMSKHRGYYWFIREYMILYLCTPLINHVRMAYKTIGDRNSLIIIGLLGFLTFWYGWFWKNSGFEDGKNIINFVFLYLLGGYYKVFLPKHLPCENRMKWYYAIGYVVIMLFVGILLYWSVANDHSKMYRWIFRCSYPYNSPILILMSSLFFMFFTTLHFESKWINWVASSTLAVYLLHENKYAPRQLWYDFVENLYVTKICDGYWWIVFLGCCMGLFVGCILIDKVRMALFSIFHHALNFLTRFCRH